METTPTSLSPSNTGRCRKRLLVDALVVDYFGLRRGLSSGCAWPKASHHSQPEAVGHWQAWLARQQAVTPGERDEDIGRASHLDAEKAPRGYPDDRERQAVQHHGASGDPGIAVKAGPPVAVAQHGNRFVRGRECAADRRLDTKRGEVVVRDEQSRGGVGEIAGAEIQIDPGISEHRGHGIGMLAQVDETRVGECAACAAARVDILDHDQTLRVGDRQHAQQHSIDKAEDGGIGADAQGEAQNGNRGERRTPEQRPNSVPEILPKLVE